MNTLKKLFLETFPSHTLRNKTNEVLTSKPTGFHPLKKREYRARCRETLNTYENYIQQQSSRRIIGNKNISQRAKNQLDMLRREI